MNGDSANRSGPFWGRAWMIGAAFVGLGTLAVVLDLVVGAVAPGLWWGLFDLVLGLGVAAAVLTVTAGHRPWIVRVGAGLLALFVTVFLVNLFVVALPGVG